MSTLNEHTSVLAAILSDISHHSDMDVIYILSANKCQQQVRKNDRMSGSIQMCSLTKLALDVVHQRGGEERQTCLATDIVIIFVCNI